MTWLGMAPERHAGAPRCGCCGSPDTTIERSVVVRGAPGPPRVERFVICPPCDRAPDPLQGPWGEFIARSEGEHGPAGGPVA